MYTGGFCSLRRQDGFWDGSGLYSADYVRDAATEAGHEGLAADRPAGRGGMQEARSEFWKGWPSEITIDRTADNETVEHIEEPRPIKAGRIANLAKLPNLARGTVLRPPAVVASNSTVQNRLHSRPKSCDRRHPEIRMMPTARRSAADCGDQAAGAYCRRISAALSPLPRFPSAALHILGIRRCEAEEAHPISVRP